MKLLGMWSLSSIDPHLFVEPDRIDNKGVAFPAADGMPVIGRDQVLRMFLQIHSDNPEGMRPPNVHDENALEIRHIKNLYSVGSGELSRATGRLASCVGFHGVRAAIIRDRLCPGLVGCSGVGGTTTTVPQPFFSGNGAQSRLAVGPAGCWQSRSGRSTTSASGASLSSITLLLCASRRWG